MKEKLVAQTKFRYRTRMLSAGDMFEASRTDARLLKALKRAETFNERDPGTVPPPPDSVKKAVAPKRNDPPAPTPAEPPAPQPAPSPAPAEPPAPPPPDNGNDNGGASSQSLDDLRARAADLGIDVDARWREKRLKEEIEKVNSPPADGHKVKAMSSESLFDDDDPASS